MQKILITGGCGFIGSAVVRHLVSLGKNVINIDKMTYAASEDTNAHLHNSPQYQHIKEDICNLSAMREIFQKHQPCAIMHLAAESHVDRSLDSPMDFINTNIIGTYNLLQAALEYYRSLDAENKDKFRFHHISTDEVYGSLGEEGYFTEETPYQPNSPYSASKASSDHLVRAWHHSFGLPVVTTNCSNNYGPYHFPEKLIPLMIINALRGLPLPIYGNGQNIRDWLFVEDHARALYIALSEGKLGETYNIGGNNEKKNVEVVHTICQILDELAPAKEGSYSRLISYVADRPGHDARYAIDASKMKNELGWTPQETFESGIRRTVQWYLENKNWWENILQKNAEAAKRRGI